MTPEQMRIALAKEYGWKYEAEFDLWFHPTLDHEHGDGGKMTYLPDPTTDANAALEIVSMMRERGWSDSHFNETWVFYDSARCETHSSTAQTFALAICEAACKALKL